MRVLILNQTFHPDVVSASQHASDLGAALVAEGHSVTVVASRNAYSDPAICYPARETWRGCAIRRVRALGLGKVSKWNRILDSLTLLAAYAWQLICLPRFDVVLAMTHPPLVAFLAALATRMKGGQLVYWVMDLNPDEAIAAGWLAAHSPTARVLNRMLCFALHNSARVVVMDRFMKQRIRAKGIPSEALTVLPPWSHNEAVHYDPAGRAAFRSAHGLAGRFVVMYSGNLSIVHPLETILMAARQLRHQPEIVFCFVGGGNALPRVRNFASAEGLENIRCLPYQPLPDLGASLSAADLHLVVMGDEMVGIVHPCKIYNVLTLGVPFLFVGPQENHITDIVGRLETEGAAYTVAHGDVEAAVQAILQAADSRLGPVQELISASDQFSQQELIPKLLRVLSDANMPAVPLIAEAPSPSPHD
jgi:colanic acid biosynthesis glycosyl transferase WcaI